MNSDTEKNSTEKKLTEEKSAWLQFIFAAIFTSLLLLTAILPTFFILAGSRPTALFDPELFPLRYSLLRLGLALPALIAARKCFEEGLRAFINRTPNRDSLITLGASAAFAHGVVEILRTASTASFHSLYFEFAAIILTLAALGRYTELVSKAKISQAIESLVPHAKKTASVIRDGEELTLSTEQISVGDTVILRHGEEAPADGEVTEGFATMDESLLTGKSVFVEKKPGDKITATSFNKDGLIKYTVTEVGEATASALTVKQNTDTPTVNNTRQLVDLVSGYFALASIVIAVGAGLIWLALGRGPEFSLAIFFSVLIVACPCGIGIITPMAVMFARSKGVEYGLYIKNGEALEAARKISVVALDKTGTITERQSVVTDIITMEGSGILETELISLSASAEKKSLHPVGKAIVTYCEEKNISLSESENFYAIPGRGVEAVIEGKNVLLGNYKLMRERGINLKVCEAESQRLISQGKILTYVMVSGKLLGIIAIAEALEQDNAKAAIEKLQAMGLEVIMITGDEKEPAEFIAKEAGIEKVFADVSAEGKAERIRELIGDGKKNIVAMVGDGYNDAKALEAANVGITFVSGVTEAVKPADMVLDGGGLSPVPRAVLLSRRVMGVVGEGLLLSFGCSLLAMAIASGVFYIWGGPLLSPAMAALILSLSCASAVAYGFRLKIINLEDE